MSQQTPMNTQVLGIKNILLLAVDTKADLCFNEGIESGIRLKQEAKMFDRMKHAIEVIETIAECPDWQEGVGFESLRMQYAEVLKIARDGLKAVTRSDSNIGPPVSDLIT